MTAAVVLLAPDSQPAHWIRDEIAELVRIGLSQPFYWLSAADALQEDLVVERFDGESTRAPLAHQLATRHDDGVLRIVRMVLPGADPPPIDTVEPRLLDLHGVSFELVNLLVPTEDLEDEQRAYLADQDGPTLSADALLARWRNVVVSPEDGSPAGVTTVEIDQRFVGHATAAIVSVAGLWVVQGGDSPVGGDTQDGTAARALLVRATSRSLVADRLSDRAVARALHVGAPHERVVVRDELPVPHASEALARGWVERAVDEWVVGDHAFLFSDPRPAPAPRPEYLGFLGTLRLLWDFLRRRLVQAVRKGVEQRVVQAQRDLEDRLEGVLLGEDARYRLSLFGKKNLNDDPAGPAGPVGSMQSMQQAFVDWLQAYDSALGSDPAAQEWKGLRSLVFGFLDGGELPTRVQEKLPADRYVVADPTVLLGPTIGPDLLFPKIRSFLPPVDQLLRPGDVAGLEDVIELVEQLGTYVTGSSGSDEVTDAGQAARRRRRRVLGTASVVSAAGAVATWRTDVLQDWSVSADWPPSVAPAALAGLSVLTALLAFLGGRRARTGDQVPDVAPTPAGAVEATLTGSSEHGDRSSMYPVGWPTDPDELEAMRKLIDQQLEVLRRTAEHLESSLVGRLARGLVTQLDAATSRTEQFYGLIAPAPAGANEAQAPQRLAQHLWRVWVLVRKPLAATVLLIAGVVALVVVPLAGLVLLALGVALAVAWIWMVLRWSVAWIRHKWLDSLRLPPGESEQQFAHRAIYLVVSEVARLHRTYGTLIEWTDGLRCFVDEPLGPAAVTPARTTAVAFHELHAHQVASGVVGEDRLQRTVAGLRKEVYFRAGWLASAFESLSATAEDAFVFRKNVSDRTRADADTDHQPLGSESSPRRWLVEWVRVADHRFALRRDLIRSGFEWMASQPPDELIDSVRGSGGEQRSTTDLGSAFLLDAFGSIDRQFLRTQFKGFADAPGPSRQWAWAPEPLMDEARAVIGDRNTLEMRPAFVNPNALLLQTILIDATVVETAELATLTGGALRTLDPDALRPPSERRTTPVARHTDDALAQLREREIEPVDGFPPGALVEPSRVVECPTEVGAYSFLQEVDGEPLRWPIDAPIDVVVRRLGGPPNALVLIRECLQRIADSSGLRFRFRGFAETFPGFTRNAEMDNTIWVGWVYPDEDDDGRFRTGEAAGLGGARGFRPWGGEGILGSGHATVLAELDYEDGFGPRSVGNVLLHELGHVVNLGHVADSREVMCGDAWHESVVDLGPGDRYGLWLLGEGRTSERH